MIYQATIPTGTRVRLRHAHDFLTLRAPEATVLGPGDGAGLVRIRLDEPAACRFEDDDPHELSEMSEATDNLEVIGE